MMSNLTTRYVRRPFEIDAVQVTLENMDEVAKWCSGDVRTRKAERHEQGEFTRYIKVRVYRPLDERQSKAFVGDWVLYAGTGYKVYTNNAFETTFVEAEKVREPAEAFKNANQPSHVKVVAGKTSSE
jgi:hypothetical protein